MHRRWDFRIMADHRHPLSENAVYRPQARLSTATGFPAFSVNLKTLGCRSRYQGIAIRPNNFEFAHEPFAIYVEQDPDGDSVVIEILSFDGNSVSPAGGRSIRYVQFDAAVVVLVLQNQ